MTRGRWPLCAMLVALAVTPLGCEDVATDVPQEGLPEQSLQFLMLPTDLQPLVTRDTSFWAVRGQSTEFVLPYQPAPGETEQDEFLTFRIDADGLYRKPNGELFATGDSVEIHITVDEEGRFLFDFQPSGLVFNPDSPARLEIEYRRLGGDLDGDGDVDEVDDDIEDNLLLWKQEAPGELWYPVGTIRFEETDELEGEIESFTGFAVAV